MAGLRVLIIEDQREVSRVLRSGLESLSASIQVDDLLSGEEGVLELAKHAYDLLICDIHLPGKSGVELMARFREHNPDLKVILMTGARDPKIRREIAQAGADAFFFKPITMGEFLDAVISLLGLAEPPPDALPEPKQDASDAQLQARSLAESIARLRKACQAQAVWLIGEHGKTLVRSGSLPEEGLEQVLVPDAITLLGAGSHLALTLGSPQPTSLFHIGGNQLDLFLAPIGGQYAFVVLTEPQAPGEEGTIAKALTEAVEEARASLAKLGILKAPSAEAPPAKTAEEETPQEDSSLEEALRKAMRKLKAGEIDAFWATLAEESQAAEASSGEVLSYEQARKLGLAPTEDLE